MSKIIFNEQKVIDDLINLNTYNIEEYKVIQILIKYFYLKGFDKLAIREKTLELLLSSNEQLNRSNWVDYIDKSIQKMYKNIRVFKKEPTILNIESVQIYDKELEFINSQKYIQDKKILFIMLVYSKIYNQALDSNEHWVSEEFSFLLKQAKCKLGNKKYRLDILKDFKDKGYINVFFKNSNCNIKVNYANEEGEVIINVTDFENSIYYYLIYIGQKWKRCEVCGEFFKQISNTKPKKYCNKCSKDIKQKQINECKKRKNCV